MRSEEDNKYFLLLGHFYNNICKVSIIVRYCSVLEQDLVVQNIRTIANYRIVGLKFITYYYIKEKLILFPKSSLEQTIQYMIMLYIEAVQV